MPHLTLLLLVRHRYPELHGESGWSLITPHRTYHLFADSEAETIAWRSALSQMAMLMVPPEVRTIWNESASC